MYNKVQYEKWLADSYQTLGKWDVYKIQAAKYRHVPPYQREQFGFVEHRTICECNQTIKCIEQEIEDLLTILERMEI